MIITASHSNQLGNTLFNHAHLMAAAWEQGTRFANPFLGGYADLFPTTRRDPLCAGLPTLLPASGASVTRKALRAGLRRLTAVQRERQERNRPLPWTRLVASGWTTTLETTDGVVHVDREPFTELARTTPLLLVTGPLFRFEDRDRFVGRWRTRIVEHFRPDPATATRVAAVVARARGGRPDLVGVHVRRGDYDVWAGGRYFYDWNVYSEVMRAVARSGGPNDTAFLVCSDEPIPDGFAEGIPWTPGPGDIMGDLEALTQCDRLISPQSTFSGWASFAGGTPRYVIEDVAHRPEPEEFVHSEG